MTDSEDRSNVIQFKPAASSEAGDSKKIARLLAEAVCRLDFDQRVFCKEIKSNHPHIQAMIGQVVFKLLEQWSDDFVKGNFDDRTKELVERSYKAVPVQVELDL